jgi:tripartite-type tricarboxylate transporter receptor subunit TctC
VKGQAAGSRPFAANTRAADLYSKLPYDAIRDFDPVGIVSSSPSLLSVHPSVPVHSARDLLELARTRPEALNYGTAGAASNPHIAGELFNYLGKVNIQAVHFKGSGPALIATISGEVSVAFSNFSSTMGYVKAGRLRGIGVSSLTRVATMPDLPTIAGSGLPIVANSPQEFAAHLKSELVKWGKVMKERGMRLN